jgi:signal peptidase I
MNYPKATCFRRHPGQLSVFGTILHVAVGCALVVILVDTWLVTGLLAPVVVVGESMAPALVGPHRAWTCVHCRHEFVRGAESLPLFAGAAVCPHCRTVNRADAGVDRRGDRVLVDRSAFAWRAPRRFEVVVLERPDAPCQWCVKRVVGLPGEKIVFRDGEPSIDGRLTNIANARPATGRAAKRDKLLPSGSLSPSPAEAEYTLGPDEYFLLGDNRARSQDSRSWTKSGIAASQIVGRVLGW